MTPEEKAALYVKAGNIFAAKTLGEASDLLDAALREARAEALEEAAVVANEHGVVDSIGYRIARRILALRGKPD